MMPVPINPILAMRKSSCFCVAPGFGPMSSLWRGGLPPLGREAAPIVFVS
jgi:hypothetical protein